ncbi:serum response factor-binding protein 1-like, partial [Chrysoperla carnea]|uniref:serum response factor-binding protein 1-like n=1 Tax=Chrysoperla carnea TaxID=189513 RepID=UPI001D0795D7
MVSQKLALNNDIVLMRHLIRQVKVHIFHKLTKNVKNLRNKKGNESLKQKFEKKAERLVEELLALKKFDNDLISKDILLEKRTANIILSDINSTIKDRVLAKVMTFSKVSEKIKEIREKYPESLIIEFVKSNKNRNKKNKKINKSNEKSSKKKEDEGVLNNSKKRKIEIDEEKETLTEKDEEVVSNKSKKKKLKSEEAQEGVKSKKKEKNISNKLNRKEKTNIESDENASGDEIKENDNSETLDPFFLMSNKDEEKEIDEEMISNKSKKKKLTKQGKKEIVKSKKKEGDEKINSKKKKENTETQNERENASNGEIKENNSETLDSFFLMSNEDKEMVSNKSKKEKLVKKGKIEIVKSKKKERDEKINSKQLKKKKENTEIQNERENVSSDEVKENGESEIEESFNTSFNGQHERDDKTISNKSKKKKEKEKKQRDKEDVFKDEIKINKKPKENKQIMEKTVDPFFLMSNGQDEYLSIVQTTPDDSTVKQQNRTYTDNLNRKQRRQLQKNGGKVTKRQFYDKISTNRSSFMNIDTTNNKFSKESSNKPVNVQKHSIIDEVQNLHPSWQAKLVQKPSVVQFQGKKIVFDE